MAISTLAGSGMKPTLVAWCVLLSCSCSVFAGEINWDTLIENLANWNSSSAAAVIASRWDDRPLNFFQNVGRQSWVAIAQHLSNSQIRSIRPEEFDLISLDILKSILYFSEACPTIDLSFWIIDRIKHVSVECLQRILTETNAPVKLGKLWGHIGLISVLDFNNRAKPCWSNIDHDDFQFMQPDVLKLISSSVPGVCSALGVPFWTKETIKGISTECLHVILKEAARPIRLGRLWRKIDWSIVKNFTDQMKPSLLNIDQRDFKLMNPNMLGLISLVKDSLPTSGVNKVEANDSRGEDSDSEIIDWSSLKLKLKDQECNSAVTTIIDNWAQRPLDFFQDLKEKSWRKLAQHLSDSQIDEIRLEEFDSMTLELLKSTFSVLKICPTIDISFWTDERIQYISYKCLHRILTETEGPVKLGKLWQKIELSSKYAFDDNAKFAWRNIDYGDFRFMQTDTLKIILPSVPEACSILGSAFWTENTIKAISTECLYVILEEARGPVKLGELWLKIGWHVVESFTDRMKPSVQKIDPSDFYFMQSDVLRSILEYAPELCSTLGLPFWTEKTIKGITGECLDELLAKNGAPVRLADLWSDITTDSCYSLVKRGGFSLDFVHPDDRLLAADSIGRAIQIRPSICQNLIISFWNNETIKYMTANCLYDTLTYSEKLVALGELWGHISPMVLQEFKGLMFDSLNNIAGTDFQYMPPSLLQAISCSERALDFLPHPPNEIILSAQASQVILDPFRFAKLIKSAPNVAGQLLWYSTKLPENVLSHCQGDDIRKLRLVIPSEAELDWKDLFARLESKCSLDGRVVFFSQMIKSISENIAFDFFVAFSDPDEYLSLTWLHPNLNDKCRSVLPFDPEHASRLFDSLDFSNETHSWGKMLKVYSSNDWGLLSQSKRLSALLGKDCDFWNTIESGGWLSVFRAMDSLMLQSILPECVLKISGILANSPEKIPLLANDAFSKHLAGQLPCDLNVLSPAQIFHLSKETFNNIDEPTAKEISQHVLSEVTLNEFKALDLWQFTLLYESQWAFVPDSIKGDALNWQLEASQSQALTIMVNLNNSRDDYDPEETTLDEQVNDLEFIEDTLHLVLRVHRDGYRNILQSSLASLIGLIRHSDLRVTFIKIFRQSTLLQPAVIGLIRNAKELRDYNRRAFDTLGYDETNLTLPYDRRFGFSRYAIIELLKNTPKLFAAPKARVHSQGINDDGGAIRVLVAQLLNDIERDLVVPYVKVSSKVRTSLGKTGNSKAAAETNSVDERGETDHNENDLETSFDSRVICKLRIP